MRILLTGAFGNIGQSTLEELLARGHLVRSFDVPTRRNRRLARQYGDRIEMAWGDIRKEEHVRRAMEGCEMVVHLAFVIPTLSATGRGSEQAPAWARSINIGGTRTLLRVARAQSPSPRIIFTSSLHIYGKTQNRTPPRRVDETPEPIEYYAYHKVACEKLVRRSGLRWAIFRLGAALPVRLVLDTAMFDVPLDNRIEFVHTRDVGVAIANGVESQEIWGKTWLIGGGSRCQLYQRQLVEEILDAVGVGMLPEDAFTREPYPVDWLDTRDSQRVLRFQRRTLRDYTRELRQRLGFRRALIRLFAPLIRLWILAHARNPGRT